VSARVVDEIVQKVEDTADEYAPDQERPLSGYLGLMALWAGIVTAILLLGRKRLPKSVNVPEMVITALATYKLSRIITKESVASTLRAPLTRYVEPAGAGEVNEEVRVDGPLHALGELILCPLCMDVWVATAFFGGFTFAPDATRLAASVMSTVAVSDALHFAWDGIKRTAE
jgi:hypothetical protein